MHYLIYLSAAFGASFTIWALAYGIATIMRSATEAMARQPEAADKISSSILLPLGMLEGAGLFAIVVCFMMIP